MHKPYLIRIMLLVSIVLSAFQKGQACSGYKITLGNKTIMGSNEDAWRLTPHIWFEVGKGHYGAAFTGSRYDGENGYAPQSGMNEMGLAFERLASYAPEQKTNPFAGKQQISNPTQYLKDIIHQCATVEEVQAYIQQYDHSFFIEDVFMYVDRSGKYLVVEPYTMTIGKDPHYVISNFCPSITATKAANRLERYRKGQAYLKNKMDTTLAFCSALSDTMHVCRGKIGDGTLLTSIWDLNSGTINLYFYHQYNNTVRFKLQEELSKGDHILAIASLFPPNPEFEALGRYKTPKTNLPIGIFILASGGFFLFLSLFFLIQYCKSKPQTPYRSIQLILVPLGLILCYYMYVLIVTVNVFYFPAPYKDPSNLMVSISSYIPFLLLLLIVPFAVINYRLFKEQHWSVWAKAVFTLNNLIFTVLIALFVYWEFYTVCA